jgi:hypothetical protein
MRVPVLVLLWLVLGVFVWNAFFDLYIIDGTQHYLREQAEFQLGLGPEPSMTEIMDEARHRGLVRASVWAAIVVAAGWMTVAAARRKTVS